jgi:serine/threonine protein kinase
MEYLPLGDLSRFIDDHGPLSESIAQAMMRQMLDALNYLHHLNIAHRDIKPDNILIDSVEPFIVKLSDFGLSKAADEQNKFVTFCGTLFYCAPEVFSNSKRPFGAPHR